MSMLTDVRLVEVGPRDGLQNEKEIVSTGVKLELIQRLAEAGLRHIEATSFVPQKWVPQLADHAEVLRSLSAGGEVSYPVLTPNLQGFLEAVACGAKEVSVFASASETFSKRNINCSVTESLARFEPIMEAAAAAQVKVRGYVSCVVGCPYEGEVPPEHVAGVAEALYRMGCYEISLGDTIGAGTRGEIVRMLEAVAKRVPVPALAGHYHDSGGFALGNILASYQFGLRTFDASVSGLGGCPYAAGASGNIATEEVVHMFNERGIATGVDMQILLDCSIWISTVLGRAVRSELARQRLRDTQRCPVAPH
ncbi:hydroxymethylglutaryl-CoA lyase [Paraburkholderia sp. MM5384-R2]|uniref:hydroxymethylglutaryl-CoA lyase n=1 Tax=Paraburkholderia sp. MM5384-R2 TaxID=2723097 RepID=UPI00160E99C9|nr:hydroxymethylglutaryl-CoA lyase [Paraburkholderia sp. MM5384-R2]MBB5498828.1 hydroxymethylglutaryl-CoA lyase [Paraburkholderia sp. MM5384-R2]